MLLEVTKEEAMEIWSQRYLNEKGSSKFLLLQIVPLVAVVIGVSCWLFYVARYEWLGYATLTILIAPLYLWVRRLYRSGQYAKKQIEASK